jgi:hypothetical protein
MSSRRTRSVGVFPLECEMKAILLPTDSVFELVFSYAESACLARTAPLRHSSRMRRIRETIPCGTRCRM